MTKCEHGVPDGEWCEPCREAYRRARRRAEGQRLLGELRQARTGYDARFYAGDLRTWATDTALPLVEELIHYLEEWEE